jgi:hypothetical protein
MPGRQGRGEPLPNAPTAPVGVVDTELASMTSRRNVRLDQRRLPTPHDNRARRHRFDPRPWDRPALIMVNQGEIYKNTAASAVPILHKAGEVARFLGVRHWWKVPARRRAT